MKSEIGIPAVACFMNSVQMGSAAWAPVGPNLLWLSKPTQTTAKRSGV